jgi:hypothetical protein
MRANFFGGIFYAKEQFSLCQFFNVNSFCLGQTPAAKSLITVDAAVGKSFIPRV